MDLRPDPNPTQTFLRRSGPRIACGVVGLACGFTVQVVGQLPVGEILLLAICPWPVFRAVRMRGWRARIQQLRWYQMLLILAGVAELGYVISDLYRGTPASFEIRGWARVGLLAVDLVTIAYLIDRSWTRLWVFTTAFIFGTFINALILGPLFDRWWEFAIGAPVAAFGFFICAWLPAFAPILVALIVTGLSLVFGARSLAGIALLSSALFALRYARGILRPMAIAGMVIAMGAVLYAAQAVVQYDENKTNSNIERESMIETAAEEFASSPLIGQGTWYAASKMLRSVEEHREDLDPKFHGYSEEEARTLSIHSQLLVTLAEGGILGGLFFIFYGGLICKTLRSLIRTPVPHRAFVIYMLVDGLWNLCMSPFSGGARIDIVLVICACLLVIVQRQGELSDHFRE